MKRRGFFGVAAGAAVAGPGMAKQAAAKLAGLTDGFGVAGELNEVASGGYAVAESVHGYHGKLGAEIDFVTRAKQTVAKITGLTPAQRSRLKFQGGLGDIDPDLASYRSFSLAAKMDMQRERNLNALLAERKSWWQRMADGITDEDPDQLNIW